MVKLGKWEHIIVEFMFGKATVGYISDLASRITW